MKRFIFLIFLLFPLLNLQAQTAGEVLLLQNVHLSEFPNKVKEIQKVESFNPIAGLFRFYKNYISSQDAVSCTFTPSCSEYALEALQKEGFITGFLNAFDRLERCNGLNRNYPLDISTGQFSDPLRNFHYQSTEVKCSR
ncbi:MAG: membrane protein insertion efficiency factor YidD [Bacteroidota bacterium]|nr:membrane protein insertion efficiency factor YidD [Bacteroidota bacterium]MDP4225865.1 membrane protein insertion efficiency factor YidD [Bacteroidota bacterium]MDP4273282.1 membrane protein insertion efficiency factor YidD [Bacteroidota bacterium]